MTQTKELDPALKRRLDDDRRTRTRRVSTPEVYEVAAEAATHLVPEGAALMLAATRDGSLIDQVVESVKTEDVNRMNAAAERIGRLVKRFESTAKSTAEALETLLTFPVYGELSYGDKPLAGAAVPDRGEIAGAYLPYTGGKLSPDKFRLVEYATEGALEPLRVVVILRPPRLTPVEISALKAVGPDRTEAHIGPGALGYATVVYVVVVAVVVLTALGEACGTQAVGGLSEAERERLGPSPSVDDLLAARRRMLSAP